MTKATTAKTSAKTSTAKAQTKAPYVKGLHNFAAKAKNYVVPPHRITPQGFKRGVEVKFNNDLTSPIYQADPNLDLPNTYPAFSMSEKYIVISVFQPEVTKSGKHEVTVRNADGDCYGYIVAEHLMHYPNAG